MQAIRLNLSSGRRHFKAWAMGWAVLVVTACPVMAQTPDQLIQLMMSQPKADISASVTATAWFDPPVVQPGEKSIYRVTFNATSDATAVSVRWPEPMPAPAPLTLQLVASGHNLQPAAGAMQTFSTFNFDAQSAVPGTFTVPEFTVQVYGKPVVVPAAPLTVQNVVPQPHYPARRLILEPAATNIYVGEILDVRVMLPGNSANRIKGMSEVEITGDGFIIQQNSIRQSIQMLERNGHKTPTFIYDTLVTPITTGTLKLVARGYTTGMQFGGPVVINGQATLSGGPPQSVLLNSDPVSIQVQPLPAGKELPGFNGAIGSFSCDPPVIATNVVNVGEPVQLQVVIRGQHNLDRIIPPALPSARDWQAFPPVRGRIVPGRQGPGASFTYTLVPLTTNVQATPAIPFSAFDPAQGKYVDLTLPPVPVVVRSDEAAADADTGLMLAENTVAPEKLPRLSPLVKTPGWSTGGLVPLQMRAWFPVVQILPLLVFGGLWFWDRRRRHLESHPEIVRRRQARRALRPELRRLKQAAAAGDADNFIQGAVRALQIVSAPHYPAAPRALVCGDVLAMLTPAERSGTSGETVRQFFAAADASAFSPAAGAGRELLAERSALLETLAKLEARL